MRRDLEPGTGRNRLIRFTTGAGRRLRIRIRDRIKYKNQNHRLCRTGGSTISARQRIDLDSWQRGRKYSQWRYHQIQRARAGRSKNKRCWVGVLPAAKLNLEERSKQKDEGATFMLVRLHD